MDKNIQKDYMIRKAWGMSAMFNLKNCNTDLIKSAAHIQDYVIQLCKLIDMTRHGDVQIVKFGVGDKAGYSVVQLIETSCITAHFSDDTGSAYIDIFSVKVFTPQDVAEFTKRFFEGTSVDFSHWFRC